MRKLLLLIYIIASFSITAQEKDSTLYRLINELNYKVDSLQNKIAEFDSVAADLQTQVENSTNQFFDLFTTDEIETMPEDQRSKKKRVDELLRAIEQRPGVLRFNGDANSTFQKGIRKGDKRAIAEGSFDIYAATSFGPGTLLFFDIEAVGGDGIDEFLPTFAGLNGDAGSFQDHDGVDRLHMLEAWGEFSIFDVFTITAGKIDLTNYFDNNAFANDETLQFLSNAFVNSSSFAVPLNSPGIHIRTSIFDLFYLQFGLASMDNSGSDIFNELYKIAGLGFRALPDTEWEANIRLFGYQHPMENKAYGYGISFDDKIFEKYNVFFRYGENNSNLTGIYGINSAWSCGVCFLQTIDETSINIGMAYGETHPEASLLRHEKQAELYARYQFNKWVYFSPHLQVVWNALGGNENYTVLGVRTHFNF